MKFKASLDNFAKAVTILVTLLFIVIAAGSRQFLNTQASGGITSNHIYILLVFIYFGAYLFRPLHYELNTLELVIHRPLKNVIISKSDIESVELVDKDKMKGTIRLFGVGGFFGYYGKFSNVRLGSMTWYATRRDGVVLLTIKGNRKIVLTPDEPEIFLRQFASKRLTGAKL